MPKAPTTDESVILAALRKALSDPSVPRPLKGRDSLFTPKQSAIAEKAIAEGYFEKREGPPGKGRGKAAKPVVLVVTEKGARRLADEDDVKPLLESLRAAVEKVGTPPPPLDTAEFGRAVEKATATCVGEIQSAFAKLSDDVLRAAVPATGATADPGPVLAAIVAALEKVKAPAEIRIPVPAAPVAEVQKTGETPKPAADPLPEIENEIVAFVEETAARTGVGCEFGELFEHLRAKRKTLSIGTFHDALRALDDAGRVRLKDWPRMLDEMPRPELALLLSSTVMYHVQPAR